MELSLLLLQKIVSMALMMLMGYACVKGRIIKAEHSVVLSGLTLYLILPCMILDAFQVGFSAERTQGLLIAFAAAIAVHALFIALSRLFGDLFGLDGIERAALAYTNGGNLIVPLASALLGQEYVLYCCAFIAVQTVLIWVHEPRLVSPNYEMNAKKLLTNPCILSIALGLVLFFGHITLPDVLRTTFASVSASIGPVAMILMGMLLATIDLKHMLTQRRYYLLCFARLIVYPLIFFLLIRLTGITLRLPLARDVLLVTSLAASAPIGVNVTQMANLYGGDDRKASAVTILSIFFCIVTLPLMILVYQLLC